MSWTTEQAVEHLDAMSRAERSLLVFLEACACDKGGIVSAHAMNADDFQTARVWAQTGFIRFSRVPRKLLNDAGASHVVEFTEDSFACAHIERRRRAQRNQSTEIVQASLQHFESLWAEEAR